MLRIKTKVQVLRVLFHTACTHCMHAQETGVENGSGQNKKSCPLLNSGADFFLDEDRDGRSRNGRDGWRGIWQNKIKGTGGGQGNGKNNIHEEQHDGQQQVDPGAVGAATRDEWIMVLEREASRADPNTNWGFDVCAGTLRTASRHALTS